MSDMYSPLVETAVRLAEVTVRNTAEGISTRIRAKKETKNDKETINALDEIINDLIADKNELIQISNFYKNELAIQTISDEDIEYITTNIIPVISGLMEQNTSGNQNQESIINTFCTIFSVETIKILQLIGFNYKEAIGIPLTELVKCWIESNMRKNSATPPRKK